MSSATQRKRPPRKRAFCLVGVCGDGNFGDEMILRVWLRKLQKAYPGGVVYVWGVDAASIAQLHFGTRLRLRPSQLLWDLAESFESQRREPHGITPDDLLAKDQLRSSSDRLAVNALFHALQECELVHLIGGGYLNDMWSQPQFALAIIAAALQVVGKPFVLTGQTIGPMSEASLERLAVHLRRAAEIELRDQTHYESLLAHGCRVRVGADDVFLDRTSAAPKREKPRRSRCLVCIQKQFMDEAEYAALRAKLSALIVRLHAARPDLLVQALELSPRDGDGEIGAALASAHCGRGPEIQLVRFEELWNGAEKIFQGVNTVAIGTRFHFALFCAHAGIAVVSLALNDYYAAKHVGLPATFTAHRIVSAQAFDPAHDGDFLMDHWPQCVRSHRQTQRIRQRKQELFKRIYLDACRRC